MTESTFSDLCCCTHTCDLFSNLNISLETFHLFRLLNIVNQLNQLLNPYRVMRLVFYFSGFAWVSLNVYDITDL